MLFLPEVRLGPNRGSLDGPGAVKHATDNTPGLSFPLPMHMECQSVDFAWWPDGADNERL
jgi:hypothetical protein